MGLAKALSLSLSLKGVSVIDFLVISVILSGILSVSELWVFFYLKGDFNITLVLSI